MIEQIFGENWETIVGIAGVLFPSITVLAYKWLKNKAIGRAIVTVTSFFTKDMNTEEKKEVTSIIKNFANRKTLRTLNSLVKQLEGFDLPQLSIYFRDGSTAIFAILGVMLTNGAFDNNQTNKTKLEEILAKYV